ncbi:hypothetical protein [Acidaminococcus timonensis]|uniref:hypothetical protein n=1 Tax=Acidaminococcus timonensis TaxID=1871002 RepID=UPI0025CE803A|nr:hypothetical protein [Acidaminococcus timonensis]
MLQNSTFLPAFSSVFPKKGDQQGLAHARRPIQVHPFAALGPFGQLQQFDGHRPVLRAQFHFLQIGERQRFVPVGDVRFLLQLPGFSLVLHQFIVGTAEQGHGIISAETVKDWHVTLVELGTVRTLAGFTKLLGFPDLFDPDFVTLVLFFRDF